ncbi:MAG: hypothetical protein EBV03_02415 [Proteobacteria bacterium]|nr:hypothetical protein [Pseudomonadota bacterium]
MRPAQRIRLVTAAWLLLIATFSTIPLWFYQVGGDCFLHLVRMDLFSRQFWQGDMYPRWLMDANSGLGSPTFLFYFPLPYYPAALLYPLQAVGFSSYQIYVLCCTLASFVSALTCFLLVRDFASPRTALLAALLYLLMPYRTEALFYRSAYAELWGMAFLPLVARYARQLARGNPRAMPMLALGLGLLLLAHVSCALCGFIIVGVYALAAPRGQGARLRMLAALGWGAVLAAYYWLPAEHYKQFIFDDKRVDVTNFSIGFADGETWQVRRRIMLVILANISAVITFFAFVVPRMRRNGDSFFRRELMAWGAALLASIFLLFPISKPLYEWVGPVSRFVLPWRMQNLFGLFTVILVAIWMQHLAPARKQATMVTDTVLFSVLLMLVGLFQTSNMGGAREIYLGMEKTHFSLYREYRTQWTPEANYNTQYLLSRLLKPQGERELHIEQGSGHVEVERWGWRGIRLLTQGEGAMRLRLGHYFFPLWRAADEHGNPLSITPSDSGEMLLDVPAGVAQVTLTAAISHDKWWMGVVSGGLSVAGWLALAWCALRRRNTRALL